MTNTQIQTTNCKLVSLNNNKVTTSSKVIAETFNKRHDHVLRDIDALLPNLSVEFSAPNFGLAEYTDKKGETRREYYLTKDGAVMLVMGYTGKQAIKLK